MYKSETCSTESATNASSSQPPEIERTYTSSDTSTKVVKKKKTITKALVKRLLGVVADLSSKVDRVLQKKDEPNTRFVEDEVEEEMINEDEEEAYYHGTQFKYGGLEEEVGRTPTHGEPSSDLGEHHSKTVTPIDAIDTKSEKISKTRKKKIVESPEKVNEDIVNAETSDVSNYLLLDSIYATSTMSFWKEWSMISSKLITKHRLHMLPLDIDFWSRLLAVTHQGWLISSVLFVINVVGAHWFMTVLHLDTWKVDIYDSARPMDYFSKYLTGGEFTSFGDSIISELDAIEYWNDFPVGHKDKAKGYQ
ncbi:unnamed protein product [Lactuca virosa]|uniref:Ubiquitin-like protease family profile domain-containing protein n=1 Tax=Lactuca virosa TaxID=75947 RepID=A0AAU9LSV9_9ASTR|nr:unnamed protein product [Lactuca virosa]